VEVDLVGKERHGGVNSDSNSFNEESIHIVDVLQPHISLFVGLNVVLSVSQELVDLFTLRADVVMAGSYSGTVELLHDVRLEGLLAFIKRLFPLFHELVDLVDVILHLFDKYVYVADNLHGVVDEGVNVLRVPAESIDTGLKGVAHLLNAIGKERLLDGEEGRKHVVVHLNYKLKVASLVPVNVYLSVESLCGFRDVHVQEEEVLDFAKEGLQDRVEIDSDEAFFEEVSVFTHEEELVELLSRVGFNSLNPLVDLEVLEFLQVSDERQVKLLDIFVFFALFNGSGERI